MKYYFYIPYFKYHQNYVYNFFPRWLSSKFCEYLIVSQSVAYNLLSQGAQLFSLIRTESLFIEKKTDKKLRWQHPEIH